MRVETAYNSTSRPALAGLDKGGAAPADNAPRCPGPMRVRGVALTSLVEAMETAQTVFSGLPGYPRRCATLY
jgi:hypothetical protein